MRSLRLLGLLLIAACADTQEGPADACGLAVTMNEEALNQAVRSAPACERDQDCIVTRAVVDCPAAMIGDCGRVVHRLAAQRYAQSGVNEQICEATKNAEFGCSLSASCAPVGAPRCESGRCVAAPL